MRNKGLVITNLASLRHIPLLKSLKIKGVQSRSVFVICTRVLIKSIIHMVPQPDEETIIYGANYLKSVVLKPPKTICQTQNA